jgi:hypothetical protein
MLFPLMEGTPINVGCFRTVHSACPVLGSVAAIPYAACAAAGELLGGAVHIMKPGAIRSEHTWRFGSNEMVVATPVFPAQHLLLRGTSTSNAASVNDREMFEPLGVEQPA